jgi:serine/threonine-protein kinase HipA
MRSAEVYMRDILAGILIEDENGYHFTYDSAYLNNSNSVPISLKIPLKKETHSDKVLLPFFDGLIPEGWLLDIAQKNWKLNPKDRMGILLKVCHNCIGAVSIIARSDA